MMIVVLFAEEFVVSFAVFLSFFWCSCLEAPLCTTVLVTVEHVFERDLTCFTQIFNCFFPILLCHVPSIFFDPEGICFGAPVSQIPTFVDDGEDLFLQIPSRDGRDLQGRMARRYLHEAFLSIDLRTWPWTPLDGFLNTSRIVLSSSLTMKSMIKKQL